MREYVGIVRAILRGEAPPQGEFFNTRFQFMGYEPRPELPIYVAALSPNMLRLAGEIADGVMLWLCNPDYIREVVVPEVTEGRERAGKSLDGFDVVAAVPVALTDDPDAARATMRQDLIPYASLPFYRAMLERSGFGDEIAAFDEGMQAGDPERAKAGLSDRMLGALAGIGPAEEVRAAVERYLEAGAISPCVGGVPGTDFDGALEAVAELISAQLANRVDDRRVEALQRLEPRDPLALQLRNQRGVLVDPLRARVQEARDQQESVAALDAGHLGGHPVAEVGIPLPLDGAGEDRVEDRRRVPLPDLDRALRVGAADAARLEQVRIDLARLEPLQEAVGVGGARDDRPGIAQGQVGDGLRRLERGDGRQDPVVAAEHRDEPSAGQLRGVGLGERGDRRAAAVTDQLIPHRRSGAEATARAYSAGPSAPEAPPSIASGLRGTSTARLNSATSVPSCL